MLNSEILQKAIPIVQRTAKVGLDESLETTEQRARWFYIWCGDVAGELGEVWDAIGELEYQYDAIAPDCLPTDEMDKIFVEVGDCLWGITAISLLVGLPPDGKWDEARIGCAVIEEALMSGLKLLEMGKKTCRDGLSVRPFRSWEIQDHLAEILKFLNETFDLERALYLVDRKLQERYPDGFTPERSVNRVN